MVSYAWPRWWDLGWLSVAWKSYLFTVVCDASWHVPKLFLVPRSWFANALSMFWHFEFPSHVVVFCSHVLPVVKSKKTIVLTTTALTFPYAMRLLQSVVCEVVVKYSNLCLLYIMLCAHVVRVSYSDCTCHRLVCSWNKLNLRVFL